MASRTAHIVTKVLSARQMDSATPAPNSASQLVSTLVPVLVVSVVWFALFLILRTKFPRIYMPRTFLSSLRGQERTRPLPMSITGWIATWFSTPDTVVLNTQTLDNFLFLRLLKMAVVSCLVGIAITWPVLFPVNATGPGGQKQLDLISMSNATVNTNKKSYFRWFAHAGCAWLYFGYILYMITRESIYYINLKQAYLVSPLYSERVSSKTVLFVSVPDAYLEPHVLREMLGPAVVRIWIPRDTKELEEHVEERDKIALKLEAAETKLIKTANQNRIKAAKKSSSNSDDHAAETGDVASRYLKPKERPTHRLKPLIGKKVDTIEWCRSELRTRIPDVDSYQQKHARGETKALHSVFVQFSSLREAQSAYQSLTHHQALHMAPRFTGMVPEEIIWKNLDIPWWTRSIKQFLAIAAVTAVVIFWTIPVAAIGAISNITLLTERWHWLSFLNKLPTFLSGIVDGLLPVILLSVLMMLLPMFLRFCARFAGAATLAEVEYRVQNYYFAFYVIQVFFIESIASGSFKSLLKILEQPSKAPGYLAQGLPGASNFYISYFILQGLGVVSGMLVAIGGLIVFIVLSKLLDSTPRKMYTRWRNLSPLGLGTVYPIFTGLFVIALAYSIIAPLVLGFACIGLYLFYLAYRYNFLYKNGAGYDTKGLMYPRALQQLFVGLYFAQVAIIGIFAIGVGSAPAYAVGPLVMMILMLIFTALYHITLNSALKPLLTYLPKTLESEERRLLALEEQDIEAEEAVNGARDRSTSSNEKNGEKGLTSPSTLGPAQPRKKPNFISKFFRPDVYTDYHTLRKLVPRDFATLEYPNEIIDDAYHHPAVKSQPPLLWVPRDPMGVSGQEVRETSKVIPITDQGASFDQKGKIVWDRDNADQAPIHEEKIYY
ncbi:MAG: hypothetical protein Q9159_006349 [Coniocarpon cinnabarinum]